MMEVHVCNECQREVTWVDCEGACATCTPYDLGEGEDC